MSVPYDVRVELKVMIRRTKTLSVEVMDDLCRHVDMDSLTSESELRLFLAERDVVLSNKWIQHACWKTYRSFFASEACSELATRPPLVPGTQAEADVGIDPIVQSTIVAAIAPTSPNVVLFTRVRYFAWIHGDDSILVDDTVPILTRSTLVYDRNDLYGSNTSMLHVMVNTQALPYIVALTGRYKNKVKEYITWVGAPDVTEFAHKVNNLSITCNEYVSKCVSDGVQFTCRVLFEDIEPLTLLNTIDFLLLLEDYTDMNSARHPNGLNSTEVPHLYMQQRFRCNNDQETVNSLKLWRRECGRIHKLLSTLQSDADRVKRQRHESVWLEEADMELKAELKRQHEEEKNTFLQQLVSLKRELIGKDVRSNGLRIRYYDAKSKVLQSLASAKLHNNEHAVMCLYKERERLEADEMLFAQWVAHVNAMQMQEGLSCEVLEACRVLDVDPAHELVYTTVREKYKQKSNALRHTISHGSQDDIDQKHMELFGYSLVGGVQALKNAKQTLMTYLGY